MTTLFEWDDSAERSGFNRIVVVTSGARATFTVDHDGHGTAVRLPRYAIEALRDALTTYLDSTGPEGIVRATLEANHVSILASAQIRDAVVRALREAGYLK